MKEGQTGQQHPGPSTKLIQRGTRRRPSVMEPGTGVGCLCLPSPQGPQGQSSSVPQLCLIAQCYLGYPGMAQSLLILGTLSLEKKISTIEQAAKSKTTGSSQLFGVESSSWPALLEKDKRGKLGVHAVRPTSYPGSRCARDCQGRGRGQCLCVGQGHLAGV